MTNFVSLFWIGLFFTLSSCNEAQFAIPPKLSLTNSELSVSSPFVSAGGTVTIQLYLKDDKSKPYTSSRPQIILTSVGGTSTGTIGTIISLGNGIYKANFTGISDGSATTIYALVDEQEIQSTLPTITVTPGNYSVSQSTISLSASTINSGSAITATLTTRDASGNPLTSGGQTVVFSNAGGTSTGTWSTTTDHNNGTYSATFTGVSAGTATTVGSTIQGNLITSSLPSVTVTPGNYSVSQSTISLSASTAISGTIITATLTTRDASGNLIPTGGRTVVFSSFGGTSTGTWSTTTDNNNGTYSATFTGISAGTATTVRSTVQGNLITSSLPTVTVTSGIATKVTFSTQPSGSATAGLNLGTQPVVTVQDSNNNTVTSSSASVDLALYSDAGCTVQVLTAPNGANAILGTTTVVASSGVASFTGLAIRKALSTLYFQASSGSLTTDCSSVMNISPGSINSLGFSTQPGPIVTDTDTAFTTQPVVTAYDAYLNIATNNSSAPITLSTYSDICTTPVSSGITASTNPLTLSNGVATFVASRVLKTNVVRIRASDGTRTVCSNALTINPGAPSTLSISSVNSPTQTIIRGNPLPSPFVVVLRDSNNNTIPNAQINWAVTIGGGTLGSGASSNTNASGLSSNLLTTGSIGSQTVTATVNGYGLLTQTFTATATPMAFTTNWPFNAIAPNAADTYSYDGTKIDFLGGVARLTANDQVDDDDSTSGFTGSLGGNFVGVSPYGTLTGEPSSWGLKLGNTGSCNGTTTACAVSIAPELYELDSSWTPKHSQILGYWKLNGTVGNTISHTGIVPATIGSNLTAGNTNGTGFSYVAGQLNQGVAFDGVDDVLNNSAVDPDNYDAGFSLGGWIYFSADGTPVAFRQNGSWGGVQFWRAGGNLSYRFGSGFSAQNQVTNIAIPLNTWTHIIIVHNPTTNKAYLNGTLAHTSVSATLSANETGMQIGRSGITSTQFQGYIDEVAVWGAELSEAEVNSIYNRQSASYTGVYTSRVMDAYQSGQSWTSLAWTPTLPFFKALPDYASGAVQNESNTDYSSLITNSLMSGIVGLWHLDESTGTTGAGSVKDTANPTASANNGAPTSVTFGDSGKFGKAATFNGTTSGISLGAPSNLDFGNSTNFTLSAWVKTTDVSGLGLRVLANGASTAGVFSGFALAVLGNDLNFYLGSTVSAGNIINLRSNGNKINDGKWHLINVYVDWNSTTAALFVDGVINTENAGSCGTVTNNIFNFSSCSGNNASRSASNTYWIGSSSSAVRVFNGSIDEVAVWSRALSAPEIRQLYQRGASRIKFQARTCSDATCTSGSPTWKGPDGTSNTFFSELFNMSTQSATPSGTVNKAPPSMTLQNYTSPVAPNQYFQYRAFFESDSAIGTLQPELKSVTVGPTHYDSSSPTLIGKTGVNFYSLSSFTQTLGAGCTSGVGYNLGVGATYLSAIWYYWNGSNWTLANGTVTESNTAAVISANASTFSSVAGTGIIYFKAYLKSSGTSICELDQLNLSGGE